MNLDKQLIQQLRNGEISVENDGSLSQLRKIIAAAFPDVDDTPVGSDKFYFAYDDVWSSDKEWHLPSVSVEEFFKP